MSGETADTFDTHRETHPDATFTEWLLKLSEPMASRGINHRFVDELAAGTMDDEVFARYLVQDHAFVETLVSLVGHVVFDAPTLEKKRRVRQFLTMLTTGGHFERAFDELGITEQERKNPEKHPITEAFEDVLTRGALQGDYEESLAVLFPTGWFYLEWADSVADADPEPFYLAKWIEIHTEEELYSFVDWQRNELNEFGPKLSTRRQRRVGQLFRRTMALEEAFFDAAYEPGAHTGPRMD